MHDATAHDDAARRKYADEICQPECQIAGFESPGGMIGRQPLGFHAPAAFHRDTRSQAFETIAVVDARSRKRVCIAVLRDQDVAHFRMSQTVQRRAAHECAPADPGSHGEVENVVETVRRAPSGFSQRGGVYIGVESDWKSQRTA